MEFMIGEDPRDEISLKLLLWMLTFEEITSNTIDSGVD
jgi:hypothetical protein